MAKNIFSEVDQVIGNVFQPGMLMIAYSVVILSMVGMLMYISPLMTIGMVLVIGGIYLVIYLGAPAIRKLIDNYFEWLHIDQGAIEGKS